MVGLHVNICYGVDLFFGTSGVFLWEEVRFVWEVLRFFCVRLRYFARRRGSCEICMGVGVNFRGA